MAFNAGDVESSLTLDRDPFTEGLRQARIQAEKFEKKVWKATVKVNIEGRPALTALTKRLDSLGHRVIKPKVRLDLGNSATLITRLNTRLAALHRRVVRPKVIVDLTGIGLASAQLNRLARNRTVRINTRVNTRSIVNAGRSFTRLGNTVGGVASFISNALSAAGLHSVKAFRIIAKGGMSATAGMIGLLGLIGAISVALGALATFAVMVFGAIAFAVGTLTTLLASIPVLLMGIIAPVGAVALGFKGVTDAAKVLEDEVDSLKKTLESTLYDTTLPGFEKLQTIMPVIETGLDNIARGAGNFFTEMAEMVTTEHNINNVRNALSGTLLFLERLREPTKQFIQSLLDIVGTEQYFKILGDTIGGMVGRLAAMFDQMHRSGQLTEALFALRPLLLDLTDMFTSFAQSAVDFFIGAAPGISDLFKSIQQAVENIDFMALGAGWAAISAALGDIIANVPPEVWQSIVDKLFLFAGILKDPAVQDGIIFLIAGIDDLIGIFARTVGAIGTLVHWFGILDEWTVKISTAFFNSSLAVRAAIGDAWNWITRRTEVFMAATGTVIEVGLQNIYNFFANIGNSISNLWNNLWNGLKNTAQSIGRDLENGIRLALQRIVDGFAWAVRAAGSAWNGLKAATAAPVNFMINVVWNQGLRKAWNLVAGLIGTKQLPPAAPIRFNKGGPIQGGTPGVDSVPILAMEDEFVVRREIAKPTRNFLEALNSGQPEAVQAAGGFGAPRLMQAGGLVAAIQNANRVGRSMHRKPYVWGGSGSGGTDCSGFMAYLVRALRMEGNPYRRIGTTSTFPWAGFKSGLHSAFGIGNVAGSHMRGTLAGTNAEAGGAHRSVAFGPPAQGAPYGANYHLPSVGGEFIGGGGGGFTAWLKGKIRDWFKKLVDPLINRMPNSPPPFLGLPKGMAKKGRDDALKWFLGKADSGAVIPPGMSTVYNGTGRDEFLLNGDQMDAVLTQRSTDNITSSLQRVLTELLSNMSGGANVVVNANTSTATVSNMVDEILFAIRHANKVARR